MSENPQLHRDMGRMEGEIAALKAEVATMRGQVADMHAVLMRAQGSWKALVGAAGFSAALTGAVIKLLSLLGVFR